jgi:hypothetical protein
MEDEYRTEKQESTHPGASKRTPSTDGLRGTPDQTVNRDDETEGESSEKPAEISEVEAQADAPATNGNGEQSKIEKPSNVIDPGEAKADTEVSSVDTISRIS